MPSSRRKFIRALGAQAIAIPLGAIAYPTLLLAADKPKLDPAEPTTTALGYTHTVPNPNKNCADCQLFKSSGAAEWSRCAIFSGKLVNVKGWCFSWSA